MITDLHDLSELCSKQFSGTILAPAEFVNKITKLNEVFELVDPSNLKFVLAFGEEIEEEDLLEEWTEKGRRPIEDFPEEILNYKFLVYDVVFNDRANLIVLMLKGDMSEAEK